MSVHQSQALPVWEKWGSGGRGSPRVCISQAFPVPGAAGGGRSGGLELGV